MPATSIVLAIAAALPQSTAADPAAEFRASLARAHELVQRGSFATAEKQLRDLLARHEDADHARLQQAELVELARRCAFHRGYSAPKLDDLVSGDLVRYDPKSGDCEVRYGPTQLQDFERASVEESTMLIHPASFAGPYTIEARCPATIRAGRNTRFSVGLGTDESMAVVFGTCPPASSDHASSYYPAQILSQRPGSTDVVDQEQKPPAPFDKPFTLKVVVSSGSVTAFRDGRRILQAKRACRDWGQLALVDLGKFERLTIKGKVQPGWLQGTADADRQKALAQFEKTWKPEQDLPAWLFERPASGPRPATASAPAATPRSAEFEAELKKVRATIARGSRAQRETAWARLVELYPAEAAPRVGLALAQLALGRADAAQATCDAALAGGLTREDLDPLPRVLLHSRSGPAWTRVFSHESARYVVKSDIDQQICVDATKILEESYRSYGYRLAPVPGAEQKKFTVFLFSGEAGYKAYAADALGGGVPESTAGLYSPIMKQLLIWNLPDRRAMFRTIRHEGFHQYLDRLADDPPTWFNEGMAEYYELADLYGGEWKEGQVNADHVETMVDPDSKWIALRSLLEADPDEFYGNAELTYPQSWAVIHYLRQGPKSVQEIFKKLWAGVLAGKSSSELIDEGFRGVDLARFESDLKAYVMTLAR